MSRLLRLADADSVQSLRQSTGSGYFTPAPIVEAIYTGLDRLGARYEQVLEPAAGVGAFIAGAQCRGAEVIAVELDSITSRLLQHRYESVGVIEGGFEYVTRDMFSPFDLVVGNPPYGSQVMEDQQDKRLDGLVIHHYFLAKSFQFLAEGGMLAMVVPAYCLDNVKKHARGIMAELGAKLVAAFRLPDDCFQDAKVTVDVVFFTKELNADQRELPWQKAVYQPVNGYRLPINEYYVQHPDHVLGKLKATMIHGRKALTCQRTVDPLEKIHSLPAAVAVKPPQAMNKTVLDKQLAIINQKIETLAYQKRALLDIKEKMAALKATFQSLMGVVWKNPQKWPVFERLSISACFQDSLL